MKALNELAKQVHENAVNRDFYDVDLQLPHFASKTVEAGVKHALFAQKIALIHSELSEALEADRKDARVDSNSYKYPCEKNMENFPSFFTSCVKDTVEDELADVIIRTLDLCGYLKIDIAKHVELKMAYNELREYKHGKIY
jgi:NTP pyrophosphatase (non-canonical NTP hydrolase)